MHQHFPCFLICRHSMPICNPVDVTDTFYLHFLRTLAMHCDKKLWMTGTLSRCEWPQSMLWISLSLKDYLSVCHCHFHFHSVNTHIQTVSSQPMLGWLHHDHKQKWISMQYNVHNHIERLENYKKKYCRKIIVSQSWNHISLLVCQMHLKYMVPQ